MNALILVALSALAGTAQAAAAIEPEPASHRAAPLPVARYVAEPGAAVASVDIVGAAPRHWDVLTQDITLARTLERWAAEAGYRIKWDAQRNFLIGAPDRVEGSFETALQTVLGSAGIRQSDYPLEACIYANSPPLVRITRQGEQAGECAAQ